VIAATFALIGDGWSNGSMDRARRVYSSVFSRSAYLPLVWGCLRSYLQTQPDLLAAYQFEQPFFLPEHYDTALELIEEPAVFAASCYLWNFRKTMALLRQVKERWPQVRVVAGGPHVPENSAGFFAEHPYVDFVVRKEGEVPFATLLRELLQPEPDLAAVPSLSWRDTGSTVRVNPLGGTLPREIDVPSPWLTGLLQPAIETARTAGYAPTVLWETNRGCPYSCTFCDWGSNTMSKIRKFAPDRLHAEIDYFTAEQVDAVLCCDANFGIFPQDQELAEHLVANRQADGFPAKFVTSYAKNADDRVVAIGSMFAHAGMSTGAILAQQSGSADVLTAVKRRNMPAERYQRLAASFRADGVSAYTEVILGLPQESRDSFTAGLCRMLESGLHDDIMIYECAVLPNSELATPASRELHQLDTVTRTYLPGDVEQIEVVIGHTTMSRADWVYMYLFGALIQGLHNRPLTRYIATYLHAEGILPYETFYRSLLDAALAGGLGGLGPAIARAGDLLRDYQELPTVPNEGKVLSQPDLAAEVAELLPGKESWLIFEWLWLRVQQDVSGFLGDLREHLTGLGVGGDPVLDELFRYQEAAIFTVDTSAPVRTELFTRDWTGYFTDPAAGLRPALSLLTFEPPVARLK
jgi:putative methyltransferase